jgi:uncharacterized protein YggT (Ycf19 family)
VETLFYLAASFIAAALDILSFAMLLRAIFSLIDNMGESKISVFLACVTEPFIIPVRFLLVKFNLLQNSPIDWSFTISYFLLVLIRMILPVF